MLRGSVRGIKKGELDWPPEAEQAFQTLKEVFTSVQVLRHWCPSRNTRVETDASAKAISGILSQYIDSQWRPIAYWSRKLSDTEQRWATGQQELLAIVESLKHWHYYLDSLSTAFTMLTDY